MSIVLLETGVPTVGPIGDFYLQILPASDEPGTSYSILVSEADETIISRLDKVNMDSAYGFDYGERLYSLRPRLINVKDNLHVTEIQEDTSQQLIQN